MDVGIHRSAVSVEDPTVQRTDKSWTSQLMIELIPEQEKYVFQLQLQLKNMFSTATEKYVFSTATAAEKYAFNCN